MKHTYFSVELSKWTTLLNDETSIIYLVFMADIHFNRRQYILQKFKFFTIKAKNR